MKKCTKCGEVKDESCFQKASNKSGMRSQCRKCDNAGRSRRRKKVEPVLTGTNPFLWRSYKQPFEVRI